MEGGVEESRSDNTQGINAQDAIPSQGNFTQAGLTTFTQTNTVANGTHQIGISQVLESQTHEQNEALRQPHVHENVGMSSEDSHPTSLGISAVHGAVQVAIPLGSSTNEGASEGSSGVETPDDVPQTASNIVTAMPAEYALPTTIPASYVLQQESEGGEEAPTVHSSDVDGDDKDRDDVLREQDRFLPIANVARIMKKSIPKTGKIAKDAKECVQECVSEFISFITSEASERCHQEKRKTINGEDILFAMQTLGFDNYVEPLKLYLQKYRESIKGEKTTLGGTSEHRDEMEEDEHTVQPFQVAGHIHPTMISTDQTPTTIYGTAQYPATFQ